VCHLESQVGGGKGGYSKFEPRGSTKGEMGDRSTDWTGPNGPLGDFSGNFVGGDVMSVGMERQEGPNTAGVVMWRRGELRFPRVLIQDENRQSSGGKLQGT